MRAPFDQTVIDDLSGSADVLDTYVGVMVSVIERCDALDPVVNADEQLPKLAERLDRISGNASRAGVLLRRMLDKGWAGGVEWELERLLAGSLTAKRGHSVKRCGRIPAGTSFVIDDYWRGEHGMLVGVVWETPARSFEWLSPLELMTCTRPTAG